MSLLGGGAVAIWHDIAPNARDAFYAWHGEEHMPERAAIPGFLRGRRYVAVLGEPEFFNLYETASVEVLTGRDYLARLNEPTPRTRATVAHFGRVARALCAVAVSHARGDGGLVATFRYDVGGSVDVHRAAMLTRLGALAAEPGVAGAHLLVADPAASSVETVERRARATGTDVPRLIVLVEGWGDVEPLQACCAAFTNDAAFAEARDGGAAWALYRLQNSCSASLPRT